ncbi:hypothetical protein AB0P17_17365 [Streptomyces sp. NPDC088124]|uniref:hypothetical protein n=1 Tax=Streptomyces sp. NPDC088124 TaxID=3154654 RepID=UPI0034315B03
MKAPAESSEFTDTKQTKRFLVRTLAVATAAGALAWAALSGALTGVASSQTPATSTVADGAPGYAVEDFNYPNADKILAERNIVLKRGDGHITLVDCASGTGFIEVLARRHSGKVCFEVVGNSGWLTLEIPAVYSMKGNDYTTEVDMTAGAEERSFDLDKNTWTAVGESGDEQGREHVLVEIRSAK